MQTKNKECVFLNINFEKAFHFVSWGFLGYICLGELVSLELGCCGFKLASSQVVYRS